MQDSNSKCQQLEDALDAYYDLELSAEEAEVVERHLADCEACTARLAEIDSVVMQVKSIPEVTLSRDLSGDIEAKILAAQAKSGELTPSPTHILAHTDVSNATAASNVVPFAPVASSKKKYYLVASAAAVIALFFGLAQLKPAPSTVASTSQANPTAIETVPKSLPVIGQTLPTSQIGLKQSPDLSSKLNHTPANATTSIATTSIATTSIATTRPVNAPASTHTAQMLAATGQSGGVKKHEHDINQNQVNDSEELVALYDYENSDNALDLGISTNEDGLYAIKL